MFNNCMADASMYNTYYTEESIGASNMARYINQDLINKMTVAAAELEPEVRQTEFDEIWSIITDEVPVIWIYSQAADMIYAKGLHVGGTYPHSRSYATRICIGNNLTRKVLQNSSKKIWRVGRASCLPSKL